MSFRSRLIILVSLMLLALVTISVHANPNHETTLPKRIIFGVVATLQNGISASARTVENLWLNYFFLVDLRQENVKLRKAIDRFKKQTNALREAGQANRRLQRLLNFATTRPEKIVAAKVVSWDPGPWFKTMVIDGGRVAGLRPGMPVVSAKGVVGRIVEVTSHFARVLLVIDYNSSVDALVQGNRVRGVLAGRSEERCDLKYVLKNDRVSPGDIVVTSGLGGIFPAGLQLGIVSRVRKIGHDIFLKVEVIPEVDFKHLEEVLVLCTEPPMF